MRKYLCLFFMFTLLIIPSLSWAGLKSEDIHPIVFDEFLLGGSVSGKWVHAKEVAPVIKGGESYKLYSLQKYLGQGTGSKVSWSEPGEEPLIKIKSSLASKESYLAVCGQWNALPRIPKLQSNSNDTYIKIVADILKINGLTDAPVKIVKNYRIDLDGDGVEEVLLHAENMPALQPFCKKGTYSLILLRKVINGKVENLLLEKGFYPKDTTFGQGPCPFSYHIASLADLNGDGWMEVIIGWRYYEGLGYKVYEPKNNQVKVVLESGMGA